MPQIKTVDNERLFADVERLLDEGDRIRLLVKGYSMRPFLRNERDCVTLSPLGTRPPRRGMVVLFRYRGKHVLHRIRRIRNDRLVIAGDGNYRVEEHIRPGDIVACADSIERNGRSVVYGSFRWRLLTLRSLALKALRTLYHDLRRKARPLPAAKKKP
jgi:hypothetical protein